MTLSPDSSLHPSGAIGGREELDPARYFDFKVVCRLPAFAHCVQLDAPRMILNVCGAEGQAFAPNGAPPSSSIVVPEGAIAAKLWRPGQCVRLVLSDGKRC